MINKTSIIICNKNSLKYLKKTIPIIKKIKFKEIIIIDGNSTDGSQDYLKKNKIKIVYDQNKGLTYARKLGTKIAKGKYLFFLGPDDKCNKFFFKKMMNLFLNSNFDAATPMIEVKYPKTYWDKSINFYLKNIRKPGKSKIIGTPTIFKKYLFNHVQYKSKFDGCDDTWISDQLLKKKFTIGVLNVKCDQANDNCYTDISKKFILYGKSDINYMKMNYKKFGITKKLFTFVKPIHQFIKYLLIILRFAKLQFLPFLCIMLFYRYYGMLKSI
jgi:glycosyltransferase involved in cell wall biosynthesis